ncbi:hypothetical protein COU60_03820 [Candidatus Pacearchaeota archaeon CG10_big_fil_rev_8_21_14_0_10_34_76]|nr:MAG: hypothetical protein COU60_03820 [Candidatus Pacearchaeota archaeon CG10_big_fil_rev_8_21_14_0_10_34_76]
MQYKNIEFVCSGNRGRSPLAEAFGRRYLEQRGLVGKIELSSSGTLVDFLKNPDRGALREILEKFSYQALHQEIICNEDVENIREEVNIERILEKILKVVGIREPERTRVILKDMGLSSYFNPNRRPQQTTIRTDAELILPLDSENYQRVINIYLPAETKPKIELIGEIEDPIISTPEEYRNIVNRVREVTERAMDKFL